ncbi:MAG: manganese/iron ABC transporter ATP-binding protein [Granulosicoccus sp.]|nr:manganese/iron ABC transporter ATP-binding protein [Granulosicoccus sp.]
MDLPPDSEPTEHSGSGIVDTSDDRDRIRHQQQSSNIGSGIDARNLTVIYRNGTVALDDASFQIPAATICALVGINGSGKSTLFKALMGFVSLNRGSVSILGKPAGKMLSRNTVAYVPQNEEVDWNFPVLVEDVVMMGRYGHMGLLRRPSKTDYRKVDDALTRVDMQDYRKRQIGELSGGQKKRVFLARALAQEGQVILLDEPFTGVDVNSENAIIKLLRSLRDEGHVILVSTHNLGSVPQFCDQVVLINRTILDFGHTETVFTQANLHRAFGGTLRFHVLGAQELHDDDDRRQVTVISDDERPVVLYGDQDEQTTAQDEPLDGGDDKAHSERRPQPK